MDWVARVMFVGLGWVFLSYAMVSFFEHQIHRALMHRKWPIKRLYEWSPYLLETFEAHAVKHHGRYYAAFDWEPDPEGRELNLAIKPMETVVMYTTLIPLFLFVWWLSPLGCCILFVVGIVHNQAWNLLHREMHIPNGAFFARWPLFRFLARHHFLHHKQMSKNFNVVFPLADYIFGTVAKPKVGDLREMLRMGYLIPRNAHMRELVSRLQRITNERRHAMPVEERPAIASRG